MSDLNEFLAVEVMGYLRHLASDGREYWTLYQNRVDAIRIPINDWNPSKNIAQAVKCAEQLPRFRSLKLEASGPEEWCAVVECNNSTLTATYDFYSDLHEIPALALSTAVARAAEWRRDEAS